MALSPRDRRAMIILGVVVLIAGVAAVFFLLSGDDGATQETAPTQVALPSPDAAPPPEEGEGEEKGEKKPERKKRAQFTFFAGRDPFNPLVVETTAATGGTTETSGTTEGTGGTTGGTGTGGGGQVEKGESMTVGGRTIVLIDIFTQGGEEKVQVEVDGEAFVVAEGETFSGNFQLVAINGGCASFLFGDQSFSLCEPGERK